MRPAKWDGVEAVLFDFDGTLAECFIDFGQMRRAVLDLLPQFGCAVDDSGKYILEVIEEAAAQIAQRDGERVAAFREAADQALLDIELDSARRGHWLPGVPDCLRALRQAGLKIGIITRNCRAAVDLVLGRERVPYDVLLTRDDVDLVKPDPAHPQAALAHLQVAPERALLVGDHVSDMHCAQAAGLRAVGVLTGSSTTEELRAAGAEVVLNSAAELWEVLEGNWETGDH